MTLRLLPLILMAVIVLIAVCVPHPHLVEHSEAVRHLGWVLPLVVRAAWCE